MTEAGQAPARLRVGVLMDGPRASRHLRDLLAFLEFEPTLQLAGVWYPGGQAPVSSGGWRGRCRRALYRLDARLARLGAQDAGHGAQVVDASPWSPGQPHGIAVDLLVRAGALTDAQVQPMLDGVRYGAIGLDFSLSAPPDEAGLALDECLTGAHQAGVVLYATPAGPGASWVIREGWFQTHWSLGRTRAVLMAAGLRMLKDALLQCQHWHAASPAGALRPEGRAHHDHGRAAATAPSPGSEALGRLVWPAGPQAAHHNGRGHAAAAGLTPGRLEPVPVPRLLAYLWRTAGRLCRKAVENRQGRQYTWQLGFLPAGDPGAPDLAQVRPAGAPGRRFQADPVLVMPDEPDGKPLVFIEEWSPRRRRGHISVLAVEMGEDRCPSAAGAPSGAPAGAQHPKPGQAVQLRHLGKVIQTTHHLSFPFHFRWRGEHYLCPEASASGRITVWRARRFPMAWEPVATLMDNVLAVDTMLFEAHGRWWMLTNLDRTAGTLVAATRDFHSELHLFHADNPLSSDWTPHPMNPLRIDSYGGRNAGLVVTDEGIFRYGQMQAFDCYGHGIAVYRITELSTTRYGEELVRVLSPGMLKGMTGLHGLHTFGQAGGLAVVDLLHRGGLRDVNKKKGGVPARVPVRGSDG